MMAASDAAQAKVLVSDFDGTMTRHDFYQLVVGSPLPPGTPDHWAEYRAGTITHFEALRHYFAAIRATEAEVQAVVDRMGLDPGLRAAVTALQDSGWHVVVASAGCDWYVKRLLSAAKVKVEVHSNPGRFEEGRGLIMEMSTHSPYVSPTLGVDKKRVVLTHLDAGAQVAFAGDGYPDAESARLVPGDLRFARGALAAVLRDDGLPFRPFEQWTDVARVLLAKGA
jgi:2,3-diketo-5-methylthio-1-phosphopentane phosphatase